MTEEYERTPDPEEVAVGDSGPTVTVEDVQRRDFVEYAGASGDFNPIHYDEPYARASGYETVFGQGMLTAGYAAHMVADWFGLANVTRFETRFEARLLPGESVVVSGEVTTVERHEDSTTVIAEFEATTRDERTLVTGEAEAELCT